VLNSKEKMINAMKYTLSKKALSIIMIVIIFAVAINSYLIIDLNNALKNATHGSKFNYIIFKQDNIYKAKNQINNQIDYESTNASLVLNQAIATSNTIFVEEGEYHLSSDIIISNKNNLIFYSDKAKIFGYGNKLIIFGEDYLNSQYNQLIGFEFFNTTVRIENSFATTISDIIFKNCTTALEVANTNTWSEATKIVDSHFINCTEAIVFKTPINSASGSYASSEIKRCFFNIPDNALGIEIENLEEFSDCQIQTIRLWMGEYGETNQIGILVNGSMFQTLLWGVVFESFADTPSDLYAMSIAENTDPAPILSEGISFLGNWTAKIHNPYNIWIPGTGGVFKEKDLSINIGLNDVFSIPTSFHIRPLRITGFKPKIQVLGRFENNEIITVKLRLLFIDNTYSSKSVQKTFVNPGSLWLTDDDLLILLPSQNIIWAIEIEAKSNLSNSNAIVLFNVYGTTT